MSYKVNLEIFEGPLDLLLYLIKKDHINIHDIPISKITEQYLQYLELMCLLDLNIAGEFLVMAATLMHIKSRMLLPPDETEAETAEEEDPRAELVLKLLEYKKFKEVAGFLEEKETVQKKIFKRFNPAAGIEPEEEVFFETSVFDLISAFSKALRDVPRDIFREVINDEFTVEGKIHDLLHVLVNQKRLSLNSLFTQSKNKYEVIATFLAVLELIRQKEIVGAQKGLFGEIFIFLNEERILPPMHVSTT
ncbi:MAG: segregation/condensation protein A [Candidatus Omnitrophica bacterium]|nr:segregation/condensation protein A [Candidatus Omnitrophota bacterium]MBU4478372.1 segregation/condensation protein A [Candidatus Omnitrophota bacterium]MCG2703961.1 segregation/condensation protein A [Candidatus Omnitrophota bacterium]